MKLTLEKEISIGLLIEQTMDIFPECTCHDEKLATEIVYNILCYFDVKECCPLDYFEDRNKNETYLRLTKQERINLLIQNYRSMDEQYGTHFLADFLKERREIAEKELLEQEKREKENGFQKEDFLEKELSEEEIKKEEESFNSLVLRE